MAHLGGYIALTHCFDQQSLNSRGGGAFCRRIGSANSGIQQVFEVLGRRFRLNDVLRQVLDNFAPVVNELEVDVASPRLHNCAILAVEQ